VAKTLFEISSANPYATLNKFPLGFISFHRDIRGFLWLTQAKSVEKRGKEKSF
jgi:hypothetical protein